jgi:hypothetical protein
MVFPYLKGLVIIKCGFFYLALWIYCVFSICGDYICTSIQVLNIKTEQFSTKTMRKLPMIYRKEDQQILSTSKYLEENVTSKENMAEWTSLTLMWTKEYLLVT